ncbi:MAG: cardiolipin synthase [Solobacterium sp.]|nr:cardiolipin synthase [Solobacterium sp.]
MRRILKFLVSRMTIVALLIVLQMVLLLMWLYRMTIAYELLSLANLLSLLTVVYVVNLEEDGSYKIAWSILILAAPVIGTALYLLCAGKKMPKKLFKGTTQCDQEMQTLLNQDPAIHEQLGKERNDIRKLFDYGLKASNFPVYRNTEATYFGSGEEMFPVFLEELKKAEKFILMEYFIIDKGSVWDEVLGILKEKTAQGVQVKLIYDDFGCLEKLPRRFYQQMNELGIETYRFNRIRPALIIQMNNRDHRKICVIDNKVGFTGGINLADEYMNRIRRYGYWKDSAVMLKGEAVRSLTVMFLGMYTYLSQKNDIVYSDYLPDCDTVIGDGWYQPFSDTPTDEADVSLSMHLNITNHAVKYLYIDTPYLILNQDMRTALRLAAMNGVDVRILVPHIPDKRIVYSITRSNYQTLINAGIRIYEYLPGFNHAKCMVSDDELALIGSINTDYRSYFLHFEAGVLMYNSRLAEEMKQDFLHALSQSHEVTSADCARVNRLVRTYRALLKVFAPLF